MKRTWKSLSSDEQRAIMVRYERGGKQAIIPEAATLGIQPDTLVRYINFAREYQALPLPASLPRTYDDYLTIQTDSSIIISDIEIPDQDNSMLQKAYDIARRFDIKTLIVAGDVIATDQVSLNAWQQTWREGNEMTFRQAIHRTQQFFASMAGHFEHLYLIEGNHDDRIARVTGGEVYLSMFLENSPVEFSHYAYCYQETCRGAIYICHPQNFSKTPVRLGQQLWAKEPPRNGSKPHIVLGHTHHAQRGFSPDGRQEIVALGCMRDATKTKYKRRSANTHYAWNAGFLMIRDGYFYPFFDEFTDWQFWLAR